MSKRKRSTVADASTSDSLEMASSKKGSSKRRARATEDDDDVVVVDLETETDKRGASSSKKKKMEATAAQLKGFGGGSSKAQPLNPNSNQAGKAPVPQKYKYSTPPPKPQAGKSNGSQKENKGDVSDTDECDSPKNFFKVPDVPLPKIVPKPGTSAAVNKGQSSKVKSRKLSTGTSQSQNLRKAFIVAFREALEDLSQGSNSVDFESILEPITSLFPDRFCTFATRRLPGGAKYEDFSPDSEVEEFCRWWLFGISAILFGLPDSVVKKYYLKACYVLGCLSKLVLSGHPEIVDKIGVQLLQVLRDLLVRNKQTVGQIPTLHVQLNESNKCYKFDIPLNENNEWLVPHYIDGIAPLLARISILNVSISYTLNKILHRYLTRVTSPESVASILCQLPCNMAPDAHHCYLTENTLSKIFVRILEAPTLSQGNEIRLRNIFNDFDILEGSKFSQLLSHDSGLVLLKAGIINVFYSEKFLQINKFNCGEAIIQAYQFVTDVPNKSASWICKEIIPLKQMFSKNGLETVLHPIVEEIILNELLSNFSQSGKFESEVWKFVFKSWDESLTHEYRSLAARQESTSIAVEVQDETLSFFTSTAALMKVGGQVIKKLEQRGHPTRKGFFEIKHLQRWSDVSFQTLAVGQKFNEDKLKLLYSAILETLVHLDSCKWFGTNMSMKFLSKLLAIPGWLWLFKFDQFIHPKFKPMPAFTRNFKTSDLQFIRGSSLLMPKIFRALRLECFRTWHIFVREVYLETMRNPTTFTDPYLALELLRAIADVSWVFKEGIHFRRTFLFLDKLIKSDLWKKYPCIGSVLGEAITSLPCICEYNSLRNRLSNYSHESLISRSGCEKAQCVSYAPMWSLDGSEQICQDSDVMDLKENYLHMIMKLSVPLLMSKSLTLKLSLSNLIISCHNHVKLPSNIIIIPMVEAALKGHKSLCNEIFKKIGRILVQTSCNNLNESSTTGVEVDIAKGIFSNAIPKICKQIRNQKKMLPLRSREKIIGGVLAFSTVGPMSMSIFVEVLKCIIPIIAQTRSNDNSVAILSQKIVDHFAEVHNCQPHEILTRVRYEIANCVVKSALNVFYHKGLSEEELQRRQHLAIRFIEKLQYIGKFRISFVRYFYPSLMEIIVPKIMDPPYQFFLSCLAGHDEYKPETSILQDYIMNYFPTLILEYSSEKIKSCFQHLSTLYKFDAVFVARQQEHLILNETLNRLGEREERAIRFLSLLCNWDEHSSMILTTQGTLNKTSRSELQELLSNRLLGFFIHLDTKLQSRIETTETKKKILHSFTVLMKLMGRKITPVRSKVYKTLYSTSKEGPQYHDVLYEAWKEFANCLDPTSFCSMTPQILAALLPLRESQALRNKVDGLISHFVCFKKELTAIHHQELYFLLDQCEDPEVIKTIGAVVDDLKQKNWPGYFHIILKEASNENPCIRYLAFRKLRDIFRFEWERVEKFVIVKGQQYVSQIISTLLAGLRGSGSSEDEKLREIIVDSLGCIGALDPVRFRSEDDDGKSKNVISKSLAITGEMNTFIGLYLVELIREFQEVKDTTNFDYCACLIQIVLKEFNVRPSLDNNIWKLLNKEQQDIITPMFTTKYQMECGTFMSKINSPIYLSEHGKSFESWLINWMCLLISYLTETKEPQAYSFFRKSMNVLKTNPRIVTFIIPFLTRYAVFCATKDQRADIVKEIKTVLGRCEILDELKRKAHNTEPIRDSELESGIKEDPLSVDNESVFHARCTQVVFSILDHLLRSSNLARRKWAKKAAEIGNHRRLEPTSNPAMSEQDVTAIEQVLGQIPKILISEVAFSCESFPAALYYLEQELKSSPFEETFQNNLDYLQKLYISLDDMDSVSGIDSFRTRDQSFSCQVLENVVNGKTQESVKSLEQMAIQDTNDFQLHKVLIQSYLKVEEPHAAETFINACLVRHPEWELDLTDVHMEALVRLQKWPELNVLVDDFETLKGNEYLQETFLTWNVGIPRVLSKLQRSQVDAASELLKELRTDLVAPLIATCEQMYPYKMAYPHILKLHIFTEIEDVIKLIRKYANNMAAPKPGSTQGWIYREVSRMVNKWETRTWNVSKSRKMNDPILYVRKHIFEIMKTTFGASEPVCEALSASIRECWLDSARYASKCGNFVGADNCLHQAKQFMSPKVMIEEAKILSRKGEKENAISTLQKGISLYFPSIAMMKMEKPAIAVLKPAVAGDSVADADSAVKQSKLLCSKALLLLAKLCEEQKLLDMEDYIAKYKEAAEVYKESEKNLFTLGSYHDRLWSSSDKSQTQFELQATVVRYYSQSLSYGCKYVYQSLPRLLSIWFDFAAGVQSGDLAKQLANVQNNSCSSGGSSSDSNTSSRVGSAPNDILENMNSSIIKMASNVPPYILMTAFTQLVSRLCHAHPKTWRNLKDIIVDIMCNYPYQTLWMTMAVLKSVNPMRRTRCLEIYKMVERKNSELKKTVSEYTSLTDKLILLCERNVAREPRVALTSILPQLYNMQFSQCKITIPFQVFLNPTLPRKGISHKDHNAYPEALVFIQGIEDRVDIMTSLIRPKKITLRGSNGKTYGLLCKPKDDLRKDSKVMEVNNVVNWYLAQNSESSQRRLHVRTYSVVPLNEECGLLEWVPNLATLRSVINGIYREKGITPYRGANRIHLYEPLESKKAKFISIMLKQTPPVFGEWFFNQFNDHQSWYTARMSYTRTAAVISIVGYIMGLGDRHCENILLDTVTGEVIHVDFNCLFNKGETFEWPERVPFRLTQNMVDGMGPLKHEGVFRKSCEIVMSMFREHASIFLSVLRPFVFDPLVEWQKRDKGTLATLDAGELTNEKAVETMKHIRHRLNGTARNMKKEINTERSVKAYVNYLIEEATSIDNLCQMWIGWAAFM